MSNKGVALFGGSFNPPTKAHVSVIEQLSDRFSKVIVMPARISPFKTDADVLNGKTRIALLKKICSHLKNVEISDYEIKREDVSYTYITLTDLTKKYDKIFLALGSDNIEELERWKNLDVIFSLSTLYFIPRPYFPVNELQIDILRKLSCPFEIADFSGEAGCSTLVPVANAFGKLDEVVPPAVARYIRFHRLYKEYFYINKYFKQFHVKKKRIEHIYRTTKCAITLAKRFGADAKKTIRAAMYHDVGKYVETKELENADFRCNDAVFDCAKNVRHSYIGEAIARDVIGERDEEVLRAIRLHTTGGSDMTTLQKIVFCADCIEEGRTAPGTEARREAVFADLDRGMLKIVEETIQYLQEKPIVIDTRILECREWLKKTISQGE